MAHAPSSRAFQTAAGFAIMMGAATYVTYRVTRRHFRARELSRSIDEKTLEEYKDLLTVS